MSSPWAFVTYATPRDYLLARRANRHGAKYALRIVWEARRAHVPISLAFAIVEKESGFKNIVGHDPGGPHPGVKVTRQVVRDILASRTSNGVGLTQLTYKPLIREAEGMGGAHLPKYQLRVGFHELGRLIKSYGLHAGMVHYNGSGPAALAYANDLAARARRWHHYLEGK